MFVRAAINVQHQATQLWHTRSENSPQNGTIWLKPNPKFHSLFLTYLDLSVNGSNKSANFNPTASRKPLRQVQVDKQLLHVITGKASDPVTPAHVPLTYVHVAVDNVETSRACSYRLSCLRLYCFVHVHCAFHVALSRTVLPGSPRCLMLSFI